MELRARIINRGSVEVIDIEYEIAMATYRYQQARAAARASDAVAEIEESLQNDLKALESFLIFRQTDPPEANETDTPLPFYNEQDGAVVQFWETETNDPVKVSAKIETLKAELTASDYKVIKAYEYSMAGISGEFDARATYLQRQSIRDQINALNTLLL